MSNAVAPRRRPPVRFRFVLWAVLCGTLAWIGGSAFLRAYEPITYTSRQTRFRAQERNVVAAVLLRRLGYPTRVTSGDLRLPPPDHMLILMRRRVAVSVLRQAELLHWVERGGQLVTSPAETDRAIAQDPLLAAFGVERQPKPSSPTNELRLTSGLPPLKATALVSDYASRRLLDKRHVAALTLGDEHGGAYGLVIHHGRGEVVLLSDAVFLEDYMMSEYDNATLVAWLPMAAGRSRPAGVQIHLGDRLPSLTALLVAGAWTFVIPAALLVAALVWRAASRFGALAPDPPDVRRSLLEHLEAAGRWLWRADHGVERRLLVEAVRGALARRVEARQPAWSKLPGQELIPLLAASSGVPPQEVAEALYGAAIHDEAQFLAAVRTLAEVRRSL